MRSSIHLTNPFSQGLADMETYLWEGDIPYLMRGAHTVQPTEHNVPDPSIVTLKYTVQGFSEMARDNLAHVM